VTHQHQHQNERFGSIMETKIDWKTRTVWIVGDLDTQAFSYVPLIKVLDSTKGKITVVICSSGGIENIGYAIYDALKDCKNDTKVIGTGFVYSAAVLVLLAGGERIVTPNCDLMIHNGILEHDQQQISTVDLTRLATDGALRNLRYKQIIANENEKITSEQIAQFCEKEQFLLGGEEIVRFGFAHRIAKKGDF
jgi:ATP-dependent Clp protease protease subunit